MDLSSGSDASFQHYLLGLWAIGNNVSALGAFLQETQGLPRPRVRRMVLVISGACLGMLLLFLLLGTALLDFFGISISAFQIAGGLLLGGVGLEMMKRRQTPPSSPDAETTSPQHRDDSEAQLLATAVVPIAIPLTVGAGTFSAVILFTGLAQQSGTQLQLLAAIFGLVLVNHLVFTFSARIVHWAGPVGMSVFIKIMGLFTLSIGVEFIVRGVSTIYQRLHTA